MTRGDFERVLLLTGELEAVRSVAVKAPETSIFQMRIEYLAEEGTTVEPGERLVDFDNSGVATNVLDLESRILDAETQVLAKRNEIQSALKDLEIELAEKEHAEAKARIEAGVDAGILPRKVHAERRLAHEKALRELEETRERIRATRERGEAEIDVLIIERDKLEHDLRSARADVDLLSVRAPAAGLVVHETRSRSTTKYQVGDSCWPGQTVMRLPDLSEMKAVFHVNEVDVRLLEVGMPVRMTLDALPGRELLGEIVHVPSMAVKRDEDSRISIFEVECRLEETWPGDMKPGMSVLGRVVVDRRRDVPLVRRDAVRFDGRHHWLRVRGESGEVEEVRVEPVARNGTHFVLRDEDHVLARRTARREGDRT